MTETDIDTDTFVKTILAAMWMLNDLPRNMRKNIDNQLGIVWLLISDRQCFPNITFTALQQEAICKALASIKTTTNDDTDAAAAVVAANGTASQQEFPYTYENLVKNPTVKRPK